MLTQREIVQYLLQRKLIEPAVLVSGGLEVTDASRRNYNCKVISSQGPSYLVKQGVRSDKVATVSQEAAVYQLLLSGTKAHDTRFSDYIAHFYEYDSKNQILILGLIRDANLNGSQVRLLNY